MSFPLNFWSNTINEQDFYSVVERLKNEGILPAHSFIKALPFFNFFPISKESHINELFFNTCDLDQCKTLIQNIISNSNDAEPETLSSRLSKLGVMNFAQIVLYKVLPCPNSECPKCPREIATHNQYKDCEYECPFYHHERDRRRLVITMCQEEEFVYKANYYEEGRRHGDKDKYSQNYFESMFHPLYYKMFKCKRDYCNASSFCPFFHEQEEKRLWDNMFSSLMRKDRVSFVKDKQKYYDNGSSVESKQDKSDSFESPNRDYRQKNTNRNRRQSNYQQQPNQMSQTYMEKSERTKPYLRKWGENGTNGAWNVNSRDAFGDFFCNKPNKELMSQEVC